jgi:hypothetical protein
MPASRLANWGLAIQLALLASASQLGAATVTARSDVLGSTPGLLAYNSGHFVPGSNTRDWWRYAGVSGARVFLTASLIEATDDIPGRGDGVTDQASFLSRRAALRADPLNSSYINWPYLTNRYQLTQQHGSNILEPYYTCSCLRQLGIRILISIEASASTFPISSASDWASKWELWQHYYFQAFYLGREFDVERFQMWNEPDLSGGPTVADYLERLKLASDAIQCALADVNQRYGKSLAARIVAPVTAGNASSDYTGWGYPLITNRRVNFLGQMDPDFSLIHQYDYHEYNSSVSAFGSNLRSLHGWLTADMAPEPRLPTSISEFNAHTAAVFDTMTETLDSPSQFTRLAAISATLVSNYCHELYCFKFSQTLYSSTVPIKKNGTHFVDNTNAPYNIGGITKGGEVWRLFNQAAAPGRDRLRITQGSGATALKLTATYEAAPSIYRLFSANDSVATDITLDVSAWSLPPGQRVLFEEVSDTLAGGVRALATVTNNQVAAGIHGANSVWLFTLPARPQSPVLTVAATDDAMVQDGANKSLNYGSSSVCWVRNNSTNTAGRSAAFVKFHLPVIYKPDIQFALLTIRAASMNGSSNAQAHVYGLTNNAWSQTNLVWATAPNLAQNVPAGLNYTNNFILGAGEGAKIVGQIFADTTSADRTVNVTDFVRGAPGFDISFLLAREVRYYGDVQDNDGLSILTREGDSATGPRLVIVRHMDSDDDGLSDEAELNVFGTDPNNWDTDGDGVSDGEELLVNGTNPGSITNIAPYIVSQPVSQTIQASGAATFSVTAYGTLPLHYQWLHNATNALAGGTNASLALTNIQSAQAGEYHVVVTNAFGALTSSNAMLTVTNPPPPQPLTLPAHEPFNYDPGTDLQGQGDWLLNGGTSGTIEGGNLDISGLSPAAGNRLTWGALSMSLRLPLGTNLTSGEVFFSFALRVDSLGGSFTGDGTLAGFTSGTGTSFGTKINIRPNGAGGFNLGVSKLTGTTYGAWAETNFIVGKTVFVAGRYRFNNANSTDDLCDLWLNPGSSTFGAPTPPPATIGSAGEGGADLSQIDRFFFRSGGSAASPAKLTADELRVGLTWASVTPPARPELTVSSSSNGLVLCWPTNSVVFVLQGTPSLRPPVIWNVETSTPAIRGTNYFFVIEATNAAWFFRLIRQM